MSIFTKLMLFVAFVVVLTASLAHWIAFRFAKDTITNQIQTQLTTIAHDRERRLMSYVNQQKERVKLVASRTRLRKYLADRLSKGPDDDFEKGTQRILRDANQSTAEFIDIWITDPKGMVVAATEKSYLGTNHSQDPDFIAGKEHDGHLGQPRRVDDRYFANLCAPAHTNDGMFLGVVMVKLELTGLQTLLSDHEGLGETGELIVATEGDNPDELRFLLPPQRGSLANETKAGKAHVQPLVDAIEGRDSIREPLDFAGTQTLIVSRSINYQPETVRNWGMVVMIEADEAYAPISKLFINQLVLEALLVILAVGAALFVAQRVSKPILRIAKVATQVAEGDLAVRVESDRSDEIGTLADAFDKMTENLDESYALLERRVKDRTRELAEANDALEQSNRDLEQYAYVASHDLQAPLRGISGFAQFLQADYAEKLDERANEYIGHIVASSDRLQQLIRDLLAYSRVEAGEPPASPCDLNDVVADATTLIRSTIADRNANIIVDDLPMVVGDKPQLSQVMQNLIANGIKYNQEDRPEVHVKATKADGLWTISVADNGIGIADDVKDGVFEIFRRLHSAETYSGTGIGLAICRRVIQRHGGDISVSSTEGEGTTFSFTLQAVDS